MARASRRSNQAITMKMVADRAGVSPMTVSNVINGRNKVQATTRRAVLDAIQELGYQPNLAAQALASATPMRVGLLYHNVQNAFVSALLVGALSGATRMGAQLIIRPYDVLNMEAAGAELEALVRSGANGVLLPPPLCELVDRSDIPERIRVPMIALSPGDELRQLPSFRIDDFAAARDITRHLLSMGHRRIGFIRAPATLLIRRTRFDGFCAALAEAGISPDPDLVADGTLSFDSGLAAASALLGQPDRPTAIVSSNDDLAAAVVSVAHRKGLHIPDDLSVVGFDDSPIAVKIWPALTTVRQPIVDIAEQGISALIDHLRNTSQPEAPTAHYLPYTIIHRESVSRPTTNLHP